MAKVQRLGRNSIIKEASLAAGVSDRVPLPAGAILRSDEDFIIWDQLTRARALIDWRECDLLIIEQAAQTVADIRRYRAELSAEGARIENDRGTLVVNPLVSIIDTLVRQLLSLNRAIGMMQTETDPRTKNASGKKQGEFRNLIEANDGLIPGR